MLGDNTPVAIKQRCYCLLRTPNGIIGIHHLNALLLVLYLEYQELRSTVPYLIFLGHNRLNHFLDGHTHRQIILVDGHLIIAE